jgi:heterodisulfide reductase subunit A
VEVLCGTRKRKAVYLPSQQAVPLTYAVDMENCNLCGRCVKECKAGAINLEEKEKKQEIRVGSIILSLGLELFDASLKSEYGYGKYKNVLTSIDFERILMDFDAKGLPISRPSDGKVPKKVAFIQCVGSRDENANTYCSSVCCMYAIKEAVIAQEHVEGLQTHIFFMDIRAFGKEHDDYYKRAKEGVGIKFTRCRVAAVEEVPETSNLLIKYVENGELREEEFDIVVLSVGFQVPKSAKILSEKLGVELNKYGFPQTGFFTPLETSRQDVYVSGVFSSPKDISDTIAQASGAAVKASGIISSERNKLVKAKEYPEEIDVTGQEPRIGVYVCHCGVKIGDVVNVSEVVSYAKSLPNVVYAEHNLFTCSRETRNKIREDIKKHGLNRLIVAGCTPRTHESLFRETCREAGLNPYLFEIANIRDQCALVHMHMPKRATDKAKDLVRMAVAKSRLLEPLKHSVFPITRAGLVIGGGLSGMTAALELAAQGYEVHLVEKTEELGGNLRHIYYTLGDENPQRFLNEIIEKIMGNDKITVHLGTTIENIEGYVGNFRTTLRNKEKIEHGVVIIAVGGVEYKPTEYLYGENKRVFTQSELEEKIAKNEMDFRTDSNIVMIQCVGSRTEERKYCSRICCSTAIKNALKIKELNPDANIYILYRDIRTYGFREDYYHLAREKGIVFMRYDDDNPPTANDENGKLQVRLLDQITGRDIVLYPDVLVLSAAVLPESSNEEISEMLKIPLNKDKFFLESHAKFRPLDFATKGVFLCGLAHSPRFIDESISQACGAAMRAVTVLSQEKMKTEATLAYVVDENCDGCAYCIEPCPYNAVTLLEYMREDVIKKTVEVNEILCRGCGICQATCPKKGIYVGGFKLDQLSAMVETALEAT